MPKINPKITPPEALIWDLWTKDADGAYRYLGRGTRAELTKHDATCEANGCGVHGLVLDTDKPPPEQPWQVVTLRPPYWDTARGVLVRDN
jgi:hypothetical protein